MQDTHSLDTSLAGLRKADWLARLTGIADAHGYMQPLGRHHSAAMIEGKPTLLVTFETIQGIQALSEDAQPLGWDMARTLGWSHLCLLSDGDTWFRAPEVHAFFDRLVDDGLFEEYDRVLFYGAGPCGYAAAAYSVAAPGATVIAVQPQATLDPRVTEWDDRFVEMRRTSFTDRYGYAPDMLDAAADAFILYDPRESLDAMHAALFTRPNVTKLRLPFMGGALQSDLIEMQILPRMLARAGSGRLDAAGFAQMYRARRDHGPYLRKLLAHLDANDRTGLAILLCRNVSGRMRAPRFRKRLEALTGAGADAEA